jgi:hypothetical protein
LSRAREAYGAQARGLNRRFQPDSIDQHERGRERRRLHAPGSGQEVLSGKLPMKRRPTLRAATSVEPDPQNGSQ